MHTAGVSAGDVGVLVPGIGLDELVAHGDGGARERLDAVARGLGDGDAALGGEKGVVGVVGGVDKMLVVEHAEDVQHEDVVGGHGVPRVLPVDGLEAGKGAVIVEVVEVLVGLAHQGSQVDGIGVGGGIKRLRVGWRCQREGKKKSAYDFDIARDRDHFLQCDVFRCGCGSYRPNAAPTELGGSRRKLYPWSLNGFYDKV